MSIQGISEFGQYKPRKSALAHTLFSMDYE